MKNVIGDRRFSADGSNLLFKHINDDLNLTSVDLLILDFKEVNLVSTSFIGRMQTWISIFKAKNPKIKLRLIDLRPEIKRQFQRKDDKSDST